MLVSELVLRNLQTKDEIKELEDYLLDLHSTATTFDNLDKIYKQASKYLFSLYDKLQNQRVLLKKYNNSTFIVIDDNKLSISDALEVANTVERRLSLYTNLISNTGVVDIISTIEQRSSLLEEYYKLMRHIKVSDWSTEID